MNETNKAQGEETNDMLLPSSADLWDGFAVKSTPSYGEGKGQGEQTTLDEKRREAIEMELKDMDISVRLHAVLVSYRLLTMKDILAVPKEVIENSRNFDQKSKNELYSYLASLGWYLKDTLSSQQQEGGRGAILEAQRKYNALYDDYWNKEKEYKQRISHLQELLRHKTAVGEAMDAEIASLQQQISVLQERVKEKEKTIEGLIQAART
jgi:hypothetical protein